MDTAFGLLHSQFIARGIPVYMGEVGLLNYDDTRPGIVERGEVLKYFEALGYEARINEVTTNLWDAGSSPQPPHAPAARPGLVRPHEGELDHEIGNRRLRHGLCPQGQPDHGSAGRP